MLTRMIGRLLVMVIPMSPTLARDPANPDANSPPVRYSPVISGTKSYRPVEPLPWGDINRRVMPPDQGKSAPKGKDGKSPPHGQH